LGHFVSEGNPAELNEANLAAVDVIDIFAEARAFIHGYFVIFPSLSDELVVPLIRMREHVWDYLADLSKDIL